MTVLKKWVITERALKTEVAAHGPTRSDLWKLSKQIALGHLVHEQPQMEAGNISVSLVFSFPLVVRLISQCWIFCSFPFFFLLFFILHYSVETQMTKREIMAWKFLLLLRSDNLMLAFCTANKVLKIKKKKKKFKIK